MRKARPISLLLIAALCVAALGLLLGGGSARADRWMLPDTEVTQAAGGAFRFTVIPGDLEPPPPPDRGATGAEAEGAPAGRLVPQGLLERRTAQGTWEPVWARPLVNPVAPVTVLVADDGRHVVTFDNWGSLGHGAHVIVIYGPDGALARSLRLTDLVPVDYAEALPHTVSSIGWRTGERLSPDGASVIIDMVVPGNVRPEAEPRTFPFTLALADGAVTLPPPEQWGRALESSARLIALQQQQEAERLAYLKAPLTSPQGCAERNWHEYLRAAPGRLSSEAPSETYPTFVLLPRDHPRHRESLKRLRDSVGGRPGFPIHAAFASPCDPDGLVAAFAKAVKKVKPDTVPDGVTFYIAAPEPQFAAIARLVAPTRVKTVWIDPAAAIPQRPERIPGTPEHAAAMAAWEEELDAELAAESP